MNGHKHIGSLNILDTLRLKRCEITTDEALAIAAGNTKGQRETMQRQMAAAKEARNRNRAWLGLSPIN